MNISQEGALPGATRWFRFAGKDRIAGFDRNDCCCQDVGGGEELRAGKCEGLLVAQAKKSGERSNSWRRRVVWSDKRKSQLIGEVLEDAELSN